MLRLVVIVLLLGASLQAQSPTPAPVLTPSWSSRVAGLQYALAYDFNKPAGEIVVAEDAYFGAVDGHPIALSPDDTTREAREMAALVGRTVKVVKAVDYLTCGLRLKGECAPSRNVSVIVVGGRYQGSKDGAYVRMYFPGSPKDNPSAGSAMTHSVVDLDRVGDNWIGTRFRLGPSTLVRSR